MPSWNDVWIPGLAVGNALGFILLMYSWEHAYGSISALRKPKNSQARVPAGEDADDYGPDLKTKDKKHAKIPDKAVAIEIEDLALYPVVLSWEDIELKVYTGDATAIKTVIHKCSGSFLPSEFIAIMGPSGAGKSSMLDVLAGKKVGKKGLEGLVTLNGVPINPHLANRCISYVGQEDVFVPMLTVWESLSFVAKLSMPPMPAVVRNARMDAVLGTLGLGRVKNSKVGGLLPGGLDMRGVSGGEKRRLSIACGLVANPSILFLDEPTTGLDSHAALAVMKYLNSLTHLGHTIVSTIHQPRQEIFKSFDKLLVMSEGYLLFLAPPSYVLPWFNEILMIPYVKEKEGTVADWLLGAIAVNFQTASAADAKSMVTSEHIKAAAERFKLYVSGASETGSSGSDSPQETAGKRMSPMSAASDVDSENGASTVAPSMTTSLFPSVAEFQDDPRSKNTTPRKMSKRNLLSPSRQSSSGLDRLGSGALDAQGVMKSMLGDKKALYARSWWVQFYVLFMRFTMQTVRNPTEAGLRLITSGWSGIFFGLVWIRLPNTAESAQERLGLLFFCLMMYCMVPFSTMAFPAADKRFFALDYARGLYSPSAYFLAYCCSGAPFGILNSFATGIVIYGLTGLRYQGYAIIQLNILFALHGLISQQMLVAAIWYFEGQDPAFTVATIYITFSLLICGFYIRVSEMTLSVIKGLSWTSFSKYTFQALAYTELQNRQWDNSTCTEIAPVPGFEANPPLCKYKPDILLSYYQFYLSVPKSSAAMLAFYFGFALISYWSLLRLCKKL